MHKLIKGALTFRRHVFAAYRDLFARLGQGQHPEALFITCSDSRVVPNLITATDPGDLFVVRNIGNIVPPHGTADGAGSSTASALEYAIEVLRIRHLVLCGHSGCGAMQAALAARNPALPSVNDWLRHVDAAKALLTPYGRPKSEAARADLLSELNVLVQLKHIKTHPCVATALAEGRLRLSAWFFEIESAQLYTYNPAQEEFERLSEASEAHFLHPTLPSEVHSIG